MEILPAFEERLGYGRGVSNPVGCDLHPSVPIPSILNNLTPRNSGGDAYRLKLIDEWNRLCTYLEGHKLWVTNQRRKKGDQDDDESI